MVITSLELTRVDPDLINFGPTLSFFVWILLKKTLPNPQIGSNIVYREWGHKRKFKHRKAHELDEKDLMDDNNKCMQI